MSDQLNVLVAGNVAAAPQGGSTWALMQYVSGLQRLGHSVFFVEPIKKESLSPRHAKLACSINVQYFRLVMSEFGLEHSSSLLVTENGESVGHTHQDVARIAASADVLLNISGILNNDELTKSIPIRVYLDLDPAFTQLWSVAQGIDMNFPGHTHFVTIGQAVGQPECKVPTCGLNWITTLQPIVLRNWPMADHLSYDGLTTVANWRGYGSVEYEGVFYGQKAHSLRQFISLPELSREKFILALAIHQDERRDLDALGTHGWWLVDPEQLTSTPSKYQQFVQQSKAEFGIAKSGYVASRCGWFSDRSICYLASGRPVVAQETGFSTFLPAGEGLFSFSTADDVLNAIESFSSDYARHRRAARQIAETYFDSDVVLTKLLAKVGATA